VVTALPNTVAAPVWSSGNVLNPAMRDDAPGSASNFSSIE
jgi:hypothetical protein